MALTLEQFKAGLKNGTIIPGAQLGDSGWMSPYWMVGPGGANPVDLPAATQQQYADAPEPAPTASFPTLSQQDLASIINVVGGNGSVPTAPKPITAADIQNGTGYALNPATGKLDQAYARLGMTPEGNVGDWTDFSFDPTGRQSLAGWAPGYYSDNGSTFDNFMERAVLGGLGGIVAAGPAAAAAGALTAPATAPEVGALYSGLTPEAIGSASLAPEAAAAGATGLLSTPEAANVAGGLKVAPEAASLESAIQGASTAGGETGLIAGTPQPGLVVPGVTGAGTSGAIGAAGLGFGAGALGAEALGNAAAGAGGAGVGSLAGPAAAGTAAGTAAAAGAGGIGATKLSDILNGNVSLEDVLGKLTLGNLGNIAGTAASVYGANEAANKMKAMYDQYLGLGAPSRSRYEASFQPGFDITQDPALKSALDASTDALLRRGSVGGNPYGNPGVLADINKYTMSNVALPYLQSYRNQNASTGGYGAFNTAAPGTGAGAVNAGSEVYTDLGRGIGRMMNPQPTLQDFFKGMGSLT